MMDFNYKKSGPIFNQHTYWTKQPLSPIEYFIKKYTKEGDTVLDPFAGTGMTGVASLNINRNCILSDISTIACHISRGYTTKFFSSSNDEKIQNYWLKIKSKLESLYITKCEFCKKKRPIIFSIVGEEYYDEFQNVVAVGQYMFSAIKNNTKYKMPKSLQFKSFELIKIVYKCDCSTEKIYKEPSLEDISLYNTCEYKKYFYPKDSFFGQEPQRNYKKNITCVYQLYSPRNLTALSIIFNEIQTIQEEEIKNLFLFAFTSILFNNSLMSRYRSYENTSIKMGTFYIPPIIKDNNVLKSFEKKLFNIFKVNQQLYKKSTSSVQVINQSATDLKYITDESIDFIYTDPPYTDIINYSELNLVWESWLKKYTNIKDEMIVNKFQNKSIKDYSKQFSQFLNESYRVLKQGKFLTIVFHHPNIEHWVSIQNIFLKSKFTPIPTKLPVRIISQNKTSSQHSTNKSSQCFLVFTLKKENVDNKLIELSLKDYKSLIKDLKQQAIFEGYHQDSDIFDFIINKILFKYRIMPSISLI